MNERERWIVYPLLALALGASLRDKLSEHTKTKTIECQELIVYGEESAGQAARPLVQIGSMKRSSADSPQVGQIVVDGLIHAQAIEAQGMQAANVNADNYFFQRIPFAPLMRAVPGMPAADQLRAQMQQQAETADKAAQGEPPAAEEKQEDVDPRSPPAEPAASPEETDSSSE